MGTNKGPNNLMRIFMETGDQQEGVICYAFSPGPIDVTERKLKNLSELYHDIS
jgi:hypothetical protein